jgi:hypothetical protein
MIFNNDYLKLRVKDEVKLNLPKDHTYSKYNGTIGKINKKSEDKKYIQIIWELDKLNSYWSGSHFWANCIDIFKIQDTDLKCRRNQ